MPVYSGGGDNRNGVRAAKDRVEAGAADLRNTESTVFSQVVAAYMDVLRTEALTALAANKRVGIAHQSRSHQRQVPDRRPDHHRCRPVALALAVAEGDLQQAEANLIAARETYIRLVGSAPGELDAPPPLPGLACDRGRGDCHRAGKLIPTSSPRKKRAEAAGYDTKVAGAGRLPTVSVFVNGDYSDFFGTLGGPIAADFAQSEKNRQCRAAADRSPVSGAGFPPRANGRPGHAKTPRWKT